MNVFKCIPIFFFLNGVFFADFLASWSGMAFVVEIKHHLRAFELISLVVLGQRGIKQSNFVNYPFLLAGSMTLCLIN